MLHILNHMANLKSYIPYILLYVFLLSCHHALTHELPQGFHQRLAQHPDIQPHYYTQSEDLSKKLKSFHQRLAQHPDIQPHYYAQSEDLPKKLKIENDRQIGSTSYHPYAYRRLHLPQKLEINMRNVLKNRNYEDDVSIYHKMMKPSKDETAKDFDEQILY